MSKKRLLGEIKTAKNGFISYCVEDTSSSSFPVFCQLLEEYFDAVQIAPPDSFVSEIVGDVTINNTVLSWGWDHMSGVYLMAHSQDGNDIVIDVANFIDQKLKKERFVGHVHRDQISPER